MKKFRNIILLMLFIIIATLIGSNVVQASSKTAINKTEMIVYVGYKGYLKVVNTDSKITWKSDDEKIATVNKWGTVIGISKGTTTITATVNNKPYKCSVTVRNPYLSSYKVNLKVGETYQLKVVKAAKGVPIKYETGNNQIATIDENGVVTGISKGGTNIKVTIGDVVLYSYTNIRNDITAELKSVKQEIFEEKNQDGIVQRIYCIITNNSSLDFTLGFKVTFYNTNNEVVSINDLGSLRSSILKNQSDMVSINPPTDREYSYYKIEYSEIVDSSYSKAMDKYIIINAKEVLRTYPPIETKFIDLEVINSSKSNIDFTAFIKFYKDNQLIKVQQLSKRLDIASNVLNNFSPADFEYDRYEVVYSAKK